MRSHGGIRCDSYISRTVHVVPHSLKKKCKIFYTDGTFIFIAMTKYCCARSRFFRPSLTDDNVMNRVWYSFCAAAHKLTQEKVSTSLESVPSPLAKQTSRNPFETHTCQFIPKHPQLTNGSPLSFSDLHQQPPHRPPPARPPTLLTNAPPSVRRCWVHLHCGVQG